MPGILAKTARKVKIKGGEWKVTALWNGQREPPKSRLMPTTDSEVRAPQKTREGIFVELQAAMRLSGSGGCLSLDEEPSGRELVAGVDGSRRFD
jgi:hypothetical protein